MKKLFTTLSLVLLVAWMPVAITGCTNNTAPVSAKTQAGRSLETVAVAVAGAMNVYGELFRAGKITDKARADITAKYGQYQAASRAAVNLLGNDQQTAPVNVDNLAVDLANLINSFK